MTLKSAISDDGKGLFIQADDFAESVTYHPHQYWGDTARSSRTIDAVVMRESMSVLGEDGETVIPVYQVYVANDTTSGISSDELDLGGDQIELPPRDGETAVKKSVTQLLQQDHGMLVLECR